MNSQGVANLTNNYLTQEKIVNDDFLVLRLGKFDRLLIFDREEDLSKDSNGEILNHNKHRMYKLIMLCMQIVV